MEIASFLIDEGAEIIKTEKDIIIEIDNTVPVEIESEIEESGILDKLVVDIKEIITPAEKNIYVDDIEVLNIIDWNIDMETGEILN